MPISASTVNGLKVTLGATLEIIDTLHDEANYEYLMTARLNQDALERFFGIMRGACGSHDHPDPRLFGQVFRLLSSYSLVKPPKGSNVEGTELLQTLMKTKDSLAAAKEPRQEWLKKVDRLLEEGHADNADVLTHERDHDYEASGSQGCISSNDRLHDHTYDVTRTSAQVQAYIAGYVVRKMMKLIKCNDCIYALHCHNREPGDSRDAMIDLMDQHGQLVYPSDELFQLTEMIESTVLDVVGKLSVKLDTLSVILDQLSNKRLPMVGCEEHMKETTAKIIDFYIVIRGHFLSKSFNANNDETRNKTRKLRKHAKL